MTTPQLSASCRKAAECYWRGYHKLCAGYVLMNVGYFWQAATRFTVDCDCECGHERRS